MYANELEDLEVTLPLAVVAELTPSCCAACPSHYCRSPRPASYQYSGSRNGGAALSSPMRWSTCRAFCSIVSRILSMRHNNSGVAYSKFYGIVKIDDRRFLAAAL